MGVSVASVGGKKYMEGTKAKRAKPSLEGMAKSVVGVKLMCYVCRENFTIEDSRSINMDFRKFGKKYRRVMFHVSCEEQNES